MTEYLLSISSNHQNNNHHHKYIAYKDNWKYLFFDNNQEQLLDDRWYD